MQLPARGSRPAAARTPARPRTAALSTVVIHAETPLAPLQQALERRIPTLVAEGRFGIGPGGSVSYSAERGALALSTTRSSLIIETPVRARAQACRGHNCYAHCEPQALVRAEVSLMLRPDYRLQPARVSLRFTQGCKVRALGGFLTIDVTPTLQAQLEPELARIGREIDRQLPNVQEEAEQAWRELSVQRELPLGACLVLQPSGIVQGPLTPSRDVLRVRFALLAAPELRAQCAEVPESTLLPPLRADASLPEEGLVWLGMVTPLASLGRAFETAPPVRSSGKQLRVLRASIAPHGGDVDVELGLAGDVCGSVALAARPDFGGSGEHIGLTQAVLAAGERERVAEAELEPGALAQTLANAARVPPLLSVRAFRDAAPALARALSPPSVELRAQVTSARAAGATARANELVAWLEARGSLSVGVKVP